MKTGIERTFLYNRDHPRGHLFEDKTRAELEELVASGEWVDHPNKINDEPKPEPTDEARQPVKTAAAPKAAGGKKLVLTESAEALQAMFLTNKPMDRKQLIALANGLGVKYKAVGTSTDKLGELIKDHLDGKPAPAEAKKGAAATEGEVPPLAPKKQE